MRAGAGIAPRGNGAAANWQRRCAPSLRAYKNSRSAAARQRQ
jgi:hypothetical protein